MWQEITDNNINEVKPGDFMRGETTTYSQKWSLMKGYEETNSIKEGFVTSENNQSIFDIKINTTNVVLQFSYDTSMATDKLVIDVGTDGYNSVAKFIGTRAEFDFYMKL